MLRYASWIRLVPFTALVLGGSALAQTTTRISVDSGGAQGSGTSSPGLVAFSSDGRYVAFQSSASNLVPGDTNGVEDLFVYDRLSGLTTRVSVDSMGGQGNGACWLGSISGDGQYVTFASAADSLVSGDTNGREDIFVHDRLAGTTTRVSVDSTGTQANSGSNDASLSADGRYVAFSSDATNLVSGDTNDMWDIFIHDRLTGQTTRASVDSAGEQGNMSCENTTLSADGRFVAFWSEATNLVPGDTNNQMDIFVHDNQLGLTTRVSVSSSGVQSNNVSQQPSLSADGRYVAFWSGASTLVPGDTNGASDVFVHDRQTGQTTRASVTHSGAQGDGSSWVPSISATGRYVAFQSFASNLLPGDTNGVWDVFIRDLQTGQTRRVSIDSFGKQGNGASAAPSISDDGRYTAFYSQSTNLIAGDSNGQGDVFVHDIGLGSPFIVTTFCFGDGTGIPCPCANTGLAEHGCNNSITTGGARLVGSGVARLSGDTLLLTSTGERSEAFSLFWQGEAEVPQRAFGDGLGCMGGHLRRMFFHNAVGGSVSAPQGPDPSVSARSASLGDSITPGTVRVYHAFYRDPNPSFCPSPQGSTFNATNGVWVLWGP